jgi:hypothetical protein
MPNKKFWEELIAYSPSTAIWAPHKLNRKNTLVLWHHAWKPEWFIAMQRLGKHSPAEAKAHNNRWTRL